MNTFIKTTTDTITLVDESGIEVLATYTKMPVYDREHPDGPVVFQGFDIELIGVEVVIANKGIEILPLLDKKQKHAIESEVEDNL